MPLHAAALKNFGWSRWSLDVDEDVDGDVDGDVVLQVVPQSDLQPPPKVDIPPSQPVGLEGTGVNALGACASPPALNPSPHCD